MSRFNSSLFIFRILTSSLGVGDLSLALSITSIFSALHFSEVGRRPTVRPIILSTSRPIKLCHSKTIGSSKSNAAVIVVQM
jgi:hypothetical protein